MTNQENSADSIDLELAKEALRSEVKLAEDLESLLNDDKFQKVFMKDFCENVLKNEAAQLISQNEIVRTSALEKIKAVKYFEAYINYIKDVGNAARMELLEGGY